MFDNHRCIAGLKRSGGNGSGQILFGILLLLCMSVVTRNELETERSEVESIGTREW